MSQVSGSNAVAPSASATVVPGLSFLAMLRCPQPATIVRKREVAINHLHVGSEGQLCMAPSIPFKFTASARVS